MGCRGVGGLELVAFAQDFEQAENQSPAVHHVILAQADRSSLAAQLGQRNVQTVLVQALRISPAEASRRVGGQAAVGYRQTMLGEHLAPVWPHLARGATLR